MASTLAIGALVCAVCFLLVSACQVRSTASEAESALTEHIGELQPFLLAIAERAWTVPSSNDHQVVDAD